MNKQNLQLRKLQGKDMLFVEEMDEASGFGVAQWLEELDSNEEASNSYGLFLDEKLIGYCTLGYADDLSVSTNCDSRLLSDVYIKPEYRHHGYGSMMVREALEMEIDCQYHPTYLTYLYDDLEEFYKPFGFVHVKGSDNIMERPAALELMFDELYQEMVASIHEDEEEGKFEITEQTDGSISVWDNLDIMDREYTITNPNLIDRDFLNDRLILTPSISELPFVIKKEDVLSLLEMVDKRLLMTLEGIVLCNDSEADFDYLRALNDDYYQALEVSDIPDDGMLGMNWYCYNKVFINVGEVFRQTLKMHENGDLYDYEVEDCLEWGILTTLIHELRHLEQSNPYLPEELFPEKDEEKDAEQYALQFSENCSFSIVSEFDGRKIEKMLAAHTKEELELE